MTITLRNNILRAGLAFTVVLFLGSACTVALLELDSVLSGQLSDMLRSQGNYAALVSLSEAFFFLLFSILAGVLLQVFFRKTTSSEMFYFIFFIISLSMEAARVAQIYVQVANLPPYYAVVLTRAIYFGRFFGVFCLFSAGLYATGIDYQRFEIVLGIALLIAFTLSFSIPVSSETTFPDLVNRLGGSAQVILALFALQLFSVLNFVLASVLKRSRDYLIMAFGLLFAVVGLDLLYFTDAVVPAAAGAFLLSAGTVLFANRTHEVYLWS